MCIMETVDPINGPRVLCVCVRGYTTTALTSGRTFTRARTRSRETSAEVCASDQSSAVCVRRISLFFALYGELSHSFIGAIAFGMNLHFIYYDRR